MKLEAVVSIGFSLLETTTHMLGVPPKSSSGATNPCVMSRLTKGRLPATRFTDQKDEWVGQCSQQLIEIFGAAYQLIG